jgi:hypothetical protein
MPDFSPILHEAYEEILERRADPQGLRNYNRLMNQGMSEAKMRESLLRSAEYAMKNPDPGIASRLGLNVHIPATPMLDDVALDLGMQWIRVDFDWFRLEPERGIYRWEDTDRIVERSSMLGVDVLATLAYTPPWASSNPGSPQPSDPPASPAYWTDIVREAVSRYRGRLRFWQFWNEPNLNGFWSGSMQQYRVQILEAGARVAKNVHPGCRVVSPGLANIGSWRDWFEETMKAKDFIDIINHHNYQDSGGEVIPSLERDSLFRPSLRTLIQENDVDDRPFWLTETGRRSEEGDQRRYYEEAVASLRTKSWVDKLFFFHYWDGSGQGNGGFGIVNEDFSPKPTYRFLQSVLHPSTSKRISLKQIVQGR